MFSEITDDSFDSLQANKNCAALRKLGIDARVMGRDPLVPQPISWGWTAIAEGPPRLLYN